MPEPDKESSSSYDAIRPKHYVERTEELATADEGLSSARALLITGGPGTGKKTLAAEVMHRYFSFDNDSGQALLVVIQPAFILEAHEGNIYSMLSRALFDDLPEPAESLEPPGMNTALEFKRYLAAIAAAYPSQRFIFYFPSFHVVHRESEPKENERSVAEARVVERMMTTLFRGLATVQGLAGIPKPWQSRFYSIISGRLPTNLAAKCLDESGFKPRPIKLKEFTRDQVRSLLLAAWETLADASDLREDLADLLMEHTAGIPKLVQAILHRFDSSSPSLDLGECTKICNETKMSRDDEFVLQVKTWIRRVRQVTRTKINASTSTGHFELTIPRGRVHDLVEFGRDGALIKPKPGDQETYEPSCILTDRILHYVWEEEEETVEGYTEKTVRSDRELSQSDTTSHKDLPAPQISGEVLSDSGQPAVPSIEGTTSDLPDQDQQRLLSLLDQVGGPVSASDLFQRSEIMGSHFEKALKHLLDRGVVREVASLRRQLTKTTRHFYEIVSASDTQVDGLPRTSK